jgi:hypothetical protein
VKVIMAMRQLGQLRLNPLRPPASVVVVLVLGLVAGIVVWIAGIRLR